jgi:pimeloyl-ACP methyl ester carboxylesterase
MAHGFGAEMTFGLSRFAQRFVSANLAVLMFDYRTFGASDGLPRQLVRPRWQLEDWRAAIAYVRSRRDIDGSRLALWGTSFSGGHVLSLAAADPHVTAIVSQVPYVDPFASAGKLGLGYAMRSFAAAGFDALLSVTTGRAYRVPIYGPPGSWACLPTTESNEQYPLLVPDGSRWQNAVPARALVETLFYRPRSLASRVTCPALVIIAERDSLIPAAAIRKTVASMPAATVIMLPAGHFAIYGECFEEVVQQEVAFLRQHLGVSS